MASVHSSTARHPWTLHKNMKRKASSSSLSEEDSSAQATNSLPKVKRRRVSGLEGTMSNMSLHPPRQSNSPPQITELDLPLEDDPMGDVDMDMDHGPYIHPASIEEVDEPHDVKMKRSTWYELEPDRIVVTDLDSSDSSDDEGYPENSDEPTIEVLQPVLDRLKAKAVPKSSVRTDKPSQALVLFQPLLYPRPVRDVEEEEELGEPDNCMDVE